MMASEHRAPPPYPSPLPPYFSSSSPRDTPLHPLDLAAIVVYFLANILIGVWAARSQRSAGDYFLGARGLPAWAVLLSIVATETSALTIISTPGIGARGDLTFLQLPIGYLLGRIAVSAWLLPGYFDGTQETAYARLEHRFGAGTRKAASAVFLVTRFLGDGVRVFAGAIPLALLTGWSVPTAILVMGTITLAYTWAGGIKAVIWTDVMQLVVYVAGGIAALVIALRLAGGPGAVWAAAGAAGKLTTIVPVFSLTAPYTLFAGVIGGAMLSAASHGTDHLIVQRLLATRSLRDAQVALVGSGVVVIFQFLLFLVIGTTLWTAGLAPAEGPGDRIFPAFVLTHLPAGLAGLVIAGILAAAMSTLASSINAMASAVTHDWIAPRLGAASPERLLRVGRGVALGWGVLLMAAALGFHVFTSGQTPVVVLALSIASVTYGGLLGAYILAGRWPRATGRDVIGAIATTTAVMLVVIFARTLATTPALAWLEPLGRLAWPWYVPLGTGLALLSGILFSYLPRTPSPRTA